MVFRALNRFPWFTCKQSSQGYFLFLSTVNSRLVLAQSLNWTRPPLQVKLHLSLHCKQKNTTLRLELLVGNVARKHHKHHKMRESWFSRQVSCEDITSTHPTEQIPAGSQNVWTPFTLCLIPVESKGNITACTSGRLGELPPGSATL